MYQAKTDLEQSTEVLCANLDVCCLVREKYVHSLHVVFWGIVLV